MHNHVWPPCSHCMEPAAGWALEISPPKERSELAQLSMEWRIAVLEVSMSSGDVALDQWPRWGAVGLGLGIREVFSNINDSIIPSGGSALAVERNLLVLEGPQVPVWLWAQLWYCCVGPGCSMRCCLEH